jgi:hypothetical protein
LPISSHYRPAISKSTEIFGGIKTEGRSMTVTTCPAALIDGAVSLGAVFYNQQIIAGGYGDYFVHRRGESMEMDRNDSGCPLRYYGSEATRIHAPVHRVHVHESRDCPGIDDTNRCCCGTEGYGYDFVARLDSGRNQGKGYGIGS